MSDLSPSIRKAAVLVLALDECTADALLDQMPAETALRVRCAVMELGDVSAAEQEAVLAEFLRGQAPQHPARAQQADVELELTAAGNSSDDATPLESAPPASLARFDFLQYVPPRAISRALEGEHEQTIALVVSRLEADLAAQVLEQLPAEQATSVLERLAWLDEPAEEVLDEIERHLRAALAAYAGAIRGASPSLAGVKALVGAMDLAARERILAGLGQRNGSLARELGLASSPQARSTPKPAERYEVTAFRYRLERPDPAPTRFEFDDFTAMSDDALKQVLATADPEVALLALTGADESLVARILEPLAPRDAAVLKRRLRESPAGRRNEIEAARGKLAEIARRLATDGRIDLPSSRRFAAAA